MFVTLSVNLHYVVRHSLRLDWASLSLLGYTKHHKFLENTHAVIYSNVLDRHTTVACLTYLHRDINHTNTYAHRYMRDGWNVTYTPPRFLIFGTYIPRLCIYVTRASSFSNENVKNLPKGHMVGAALWKRNPHCMIPNSKGQGQAASNPSPLHQFSSFHDWKREGH